MSNGSPISTRDEATDLVNFKIMLNGAAIKGEYGILSLSITKGYNRISNAKIVIADGDPAFKDFVISSQEEAFKPGSEIEISMGYHEKTKTVFKGIIVRHGINSAKGKISKLAIEAKDKAIKLSIARKNTCYVDQTDEDIINAIVSKYGLKAEIGAGTLKHKQMVQYNAIDWDFILSRAEMNGMLVLTSDNKLVIKAPDTSKDPVTELVFGTDILEFESDMDAGSQIKNVTSHSWNSADQKIEDSAEANLKYKEGGNLSSDSLAAAMGVSEFHLNHAGDLSSAELKSWANAKMLKSLLAKTQAKIRIKGTSEINSSDVITLSGFSKRFNGRQLVTGIHHSYDKSIWETEVIIGMPEQWFHERVEILEKPAAGIVPGVNGLQIGVVMQLEKDPDRQDRVKIKMPLVDANEGIWARVSSLDAGKERGAFFRPEINDEVLVGFLNDDPRHPVILGMLHSGAHPAPMQAKDDNHEKGFVTRSKMKFVFNDDKKSITVETPKGKKLIIDEDGDSIQLLDEHQNKISLTSSGISIESVKDISLKSTGGKITAEALNIEHKASISFKAEGQASATLQATGQTVVKGAVVNIN